MHIQAIKETHNPEIALIILCCRQFIHASSDNVVSEFIQHNHLNWNDVYQLSKTHRIRPIIYQELAQVKNLIGSENLEEFRKYAFYFNAVALNNKKELDRILSLLKEHNISAHPFKGIAFAENIYGKIGLREFSDNDIIIRETDIPQVIALMTEEGYHSKDTAFYNRFPGQYIRDYKDLLFEKMNRDVREFAIEFHFKPLRFFQSNTLSFAQVLGNEYLSAEEPYNATGHLQLMTLNNGVMDFYPDVRSVLDLAMTLKRTTPFETENLDPLISKYLNYGVFMCRSLLLYPSGFSYRFTASQNNFCNVMLQNILQMKEKKRATASLNIHTNLKTATSFPGKITIIRNWLLLLLRPSEGDVAGIYLPRYFLYYFTKPFRLILKSIIRK